MDILTEDNIMGENNQIVKSTEVIDKELEIEGNLGFSPDEEGYPIKGTDDKTEVKSKKEKHSKNEANDEKETDKEVLKKYDIKGKELSSPELPNQERTDERTYKENVKQSNEKDYSQNNETYDKNSDNFKIEDSVLNPETETQFQEPDPDDPKILNQNGKGVKGVNNKMKNKNQPL